MNEHPYVILADDDEDDRSIFREVLHRINSMIHLETVEDGAQLLEKLSQIIFIPDYIFIDLNMPCKNGHQCLEEIRKDEKLDHTPVIIYSTSSWEGDIESTYEKGANLYIMKPHALSRIEFLLRKVLSLNWTDYFPRPQRQLFVLE
jgi:CheY-like chemotaxis protein